LWLLFDILFILFTLWNSVTDYYSVTVIPCCGRIRDLGITMGIRCCVMPGGIRCYFPAVG
jgi:hypothetical protein